MGTPLVSEQFGDLLEPGLRKIYDDVYKEPDDPIGMLYNVSTSSTSYEKDSQVGSIGDLEDFDATGQIQYDDVVQGYDTQYNHKQYTKGFKVERKLYDDDLYGIINKKPRALAIAVKRTVDKHKAQPLNEAFSAAGTVYMTGMDGLSLCNNAHTSTYPSGYTNIDNAGSTALSATSVEATRRLMVKWTDDRGNLISVVPDTIIVPRALEETGWVIISSRGKVDSSDNNPNFHQGKYKLIVSDRLNDSNNWFMIDSGLCKLMLNFFMRIPPEFAQDKDFDTLIAKFRIYTRYSLGWSDWRWIYGHNVA